MTERLLVCGFLCMVSSGVLAQEVRGQVISKHATQLAAPMDGRVISLKKRPGESVKAGDVIAEFDCRSLKAEERVAAARLSAASTQYKVNQRLAKYDNVSSLDVDLSRADVNEANAVFKQAKERLADCQVTAPFDAEVITREVGVFQHVASGTPLFGLVSATEMEIEAVIPASWLPQVQDDAMVQFRADATGEVLGAKVVRIIDNIDPVSQTLKIIAEPKQSELEHFKPGMSGVVQFEFAAQSSVEP